MSINFEDALKAKRLRDYFNDKGRVYIVVDATNDEVDVPDFLRGDPALRLVLNARMPQPIYIRDTFLESNFSFSGAAHRCIIPMNCIWATYQPESDMSTGIIWDDAIPETVRAMMDAMGGFEEEDATSDSEVEGYTGLSVVESTEEMKPEDDTAPKTEKGRKIGHLRVVK